MTWRHPATNVLSSRRLRVGAVALLLAMTIGGCAGERGEASPTATNLADADGYALDLVDETNRAREQEGLEPLAISACAADRAAARARVQASAGTLEHAPLDDVFHACPGFTAAAENLVDSAAPPADVVEAWLDSPGHRQNVVNPALTEIGIACVPSAKGLLCSQIFLGP